MVLLTVTPAAKAAIARRCALGRSDTNVVDDDFACRLDDLATVDVGGPVEHEALSRVSKDLISHDWEDGQDAVARQWRLDTLLAGARIYQPAPSAKPEPTAEYKALMKRLRADEERREYDRMVNPPSAPLHETFSQRFPGASQSFHPSTSIGHAPGADDVDETTYADVNRQMALIINVLVSIIACSVAIWLAARRWDVPQRLGLSMSGSGLVAVAEVAIYMGYIRRIKTAKETEVKKIETREIVETWTSDSVAKTTTADAESTNMRYRKGRHR